MENVMSENATSGQGRFFRLHPDLAVHSSAIAGCGTFAVRDLPQGTLLLVMGGQIVTLQEEANLPPKMQDAGVQIAADLVLSPISINDIGGINHVNHSCDPNAGFQGQMFLVAMRDITPGEEVTFDYAMCLGGGGTPYQLQCGCGATRCRRQITERDWMIPELQTRYRGFFQPYLQAQIGAQADHGGTGYERDAQVSVGQNRNQAVKNFAE